MKIFILFIILAAFIRGTYQKDLLLDPLISNTAPFSHYQCVKHTYDEIAIWLNMGDKGITTQPQTVINAKNAGLNLHIGLSPCRSVIVENHINEIFRVLSNVPIVRIWLEPLIVAGSGNVCSWDRFPAP